MKRLELFGHSVPERAIVGFLGEDAVAISNEIGALSSRDGREVVVANYALDSRDPLSVLRAKRDLMAAQHRGATVLLASYREELLLELCDEVWWIEGCELRAQGDPVEVLEKWRHHILQVWKTEQTGVAVPMLPSLDLGDGRARIESVELLNAAGQQVRGWTSGERVSIRVIVEFLHPVDDPVIGILIRTRIGLNVYGTNTELEKLQLGPRSRGDRLQLLFHFRAELCPGEYTLTVASHDPDATWHHWLEDVVAFTVADTRYTAGVANLRAQVEWALLGDT